MAIIVYKAFPNLPKNNDYQRIEDGKVNPDSTLISRFIRYNQDVKKRSDLYRLDWQLTMADYLGFNESIKLDRYPGHSSLQTNPMQADIDTIRSLKRSTRRALIDYIASIYSPTDQNPAQKSKTKEVITPTTPTKPTLSKPGDANLLLMP